MEIERLIERIEEIELIIEDLKECNIRQDTSLNAQAQALAAYNKAKSNTTLIESLNRKLNSACCIFLGLFMLKISLDDTNHLFSPMNKLLFGSSIGIIILGVLVLTNLEIPVVEILLKRIRLPFLKDGDVDE
jgi:hypothetical protein